MEYSYFAAFLVGLMGSAHCIGMCGGFMAALSSQIPTFDHESRLFTILKFQLTYGIGKIISYSIAGILCGAITSSIHSLFEIKFYLIFLRFFAGFMMIIAGLYISNIWRGLTYIEKFGYYFWQKIQPFSKNLLPINSLGKAFNAGLIWGWLPCGLVYSMLTWAIASASMIKGGMILMSFGIGTLPVLVLTGIAAKNLALLVQHKTIQLISGLALILFGFQTCYIGLSQLN